MSNKLGYNSVADLRQTIPISSGRRYDLISVTRYATFGSRKRANSGSPISMQTCSRRSIEPNFLGEFNRRFVVLDLVLESRGRALHATPRHPNPSQGRSVPSSRMPLLRVLDDRLGHCSPQRDGRAATERRARARHGMTACTGRSTKAIWVELHSLGGGTTAHRRTRSVRRSQLYSVRVSRRRRTVAAVGLASSSSGRTASSSAIAAGTIATAGLVSSASVFTAA